MKHQMKGTLMTNCGPNKYDVVGSFLRPAKLKEACPYLFGQQERKTASTGGKPVGDAPSDGMERLRRIAGLKTKE